VRSASGGAPTVAEVSLLFADILSDKETNDASATLSRFTGAAASLLSLVTNSDFAAADRLTESSYSPVVSNLFQTVVAKAPLAQVSVSSDASSLCQVLSVMEGMLSTPQFVDIGSAVHLAESLRSYISAFVSLRQDELRRVRGATPSVEEVMDIRTTECLNAKLLAKVVSRLVGIGARGRFVELAPVAANASASASATGRIAGVAAVSSAPVVNSSLQPQAAIVFGAPPATNAQRAKIAKALHGLVFDALLSSIAGGMYAGQTRETLVDRSGLYVRCAARAFEPFVSATSIKVTDPSDGTVGSIPLSVPLAATHDPYTVSQYRFNFTSQMSVWVPRKFGAGGTLSLCGAVMPSWVKDVITSPSSAQLTNAGRSTTAAYSIATAAGKLLEKRREVTTSAHRAASVQDFGGIRDAVAQQSTTVPTPATLPPADRAMQLAEPVPAVNEVVTFETVVPWDFDFEGFNVGCGVWEDNSATPTGRYVNVTVNSTIPSAAEIAALPLQQATVQTYCVPRVIREIAPTPTRLQCACVGVAPRHNLDIASIAIERRPSDSSNVPPPPPVSEPFMFTPFDFSPRSVLPVSGAAPGGRNVFAPVVQGVSMFLALIFGVATVFLAFLRESTSNREIDEVQRSLAAKDGTSAEPMATPADPYPQADQWNPTLFPPGGPSFFGAFLRGFRWTRLLVGEKDVRWRGLTVLRQVAIALAGAHFTLIFVILWYASPFWDDVSSPTDTAFEWQSLLVGFCVAVFVEVVLFVIAFPLRYSEPLCGSLDVDHAVLAPSTGPVLTQRPSTVRRRVAPAYTSPSTMRYVDRVAATAHMDEGLVAAAPLRDEPSPSGTRARHLAVPRPTALPRVISTDGAGVSSPAHAASSPNGQLNPDDVPRGRGPQPTDPPITVKGLYDEALACIQAMQLLPAAQILLEACRLSDAVDGPTEVRGLATVTDARNFIFLRCGLATKDEFDTAWAAAESDPSWQLAITLTRADHVRPAENLFRLLLAEQNSLLDVVMEESAHGSCWVEHYFLLSAPAAEVATRSAVLMGLWDNSDSLGGPVSRNSFAMTCPVAVPDGFLLAGVAGSRSARPATTTLTSTTAPLTDAQRAEREEKVMSRLLTDLLAARASTEDGPLPHVPWKEAVQMVTKGHYLTAATAFRVAVKKEGDPPLDRPKSAAFGKGWAFFYAKFAMDVREEPFEAQWAANVADAAARFGIVVHGASNAQLTPSTADAAALPAFYVKRYVHVAPDLSAQHTVGGARAGAGGGPVDGDGSATNPFRGVRAAVRSGALRSGDALLLRGGTYRPFVLALERPPSEDPASLVTVSDATAPGTGQSLMLHVLPRSVADVVHVSGPVGVFHPAHRGHPPLKVSLCSLQITDAPTGVGVYSQDPSDAPSVAVGVERCVFGRCARLCGAGASLRGDENVTAQAAFVSTPAGSPSGGAAARSATPERSLVAAPIKDAAPMPTFYSSQGLPVSQNGYAHDETYGRMSSNDYDENSNGYGEGAPSSTLVLPPSALAPRSGDSRWGAEGDIRRALWMPAWAAGLTVIAVCVVIALLDVFTAIWSMDWGTDDARYNGMWLACVFGWIWWVVLDVIVALVVRDEFMW